MTTTIDSNPTPDLGREKHQQQSGLRGAMARLAVGRGVAMGVALAATPILARLYSPGNFGTLAILTTIAAVLGPTATLSYVRAIPLVPDRAGRRDLVVLSGIILFFGTVAVTIAVFVTADFLAEVYDVPELAVYILLLPLVFAIGGLEQMGTTLLNSERMFGIVAIRDVITAVMTVFCGVLAGILFLGGSTAGLLFGLLVGTFAGAVFSGINALTYVLFRVPEPLERRNLFYSAVRYHDFPMLANWASTINAVTTGLPVLLLGVFFPLQVVGLYSVSHRLITLPVSLFTVTSGQAYYVEAASAVNNGDSARDVTLSLVRTLSLLTTFPLLATLVLAPSVFAIVLGHAWREAGVYAQILAPWIMVVAIGSPLTGMYAIARRQGEGLLFQTTLLIGRATSLLVGGLLLSSPRSTIVLFSMAGIVVNLWGLWRCLKFAGTSRRAVASILAKGIAEAGVFLAPAAVVVYVTHLDLIALALGLSGGCGYVWLMGRRHSKELRIFIEKYLRPASLSSNVL